MQATPTFCDLHPQSVPAHVEAQVWDDGVDPLHPQFGDHVIKAAPGGSRGKDGVRGEDGNREQDEDSYFEWEG